MGCRAYPPLQPNQRVAGKLGIQLGWYDKDKFDSKTYLEKERVENGDMNWIVPDMFLAFSSPSAAKYDEDGVYF